MAQLNSRALELLSNDEELQIAIGKVFKRPRKVRTVKRWIAENDELLTTRAALNLIKNKFALTDDEILKEEESEFAKAG